jgi:hypothetical protein
MKNVNTTKEREAGFGDSFELSAGEGGEKIVMPRGRKSEKGVVLVVVLVLSAVVLAVMTALIYMITSGTQISGFQKRYKTSLEAAKGGSELFYQVVGSRGDTSALSNVSPSILGASTCTGTDVYTGATYTGFQAKLRTPSSTWSSGCNSSLTINLTDSTPYDMKLVIGTAPQYNYYAKIVGTIEGNSASLGSSKLYNGSVITGSGGVGAIPVVSKPYLYAIEVDSENSSNPAERAKLSILYQY